jgi:PqqA peptide cyclase
MCNHSPVVMGNLFRETPQTILSSAYAASWENSHPAYCSGCTKWATCRGGCRAASEQLGGTLEHEDPIIGLLLQNRSAA